MLNQDIDGEKGRDINLKGLDKRKEDRNLKLMLSDLDDLEVYRNTQKHLTISITTKV